jgi:hypothetical protein
VLKQRLKRILDSFSRRHRTSPTYPPDIVSERLRNRVLLLYREVFSGRWPTNEWSSPGDHTREFWDQLGVSLQHLYGRPKLSKRTVHSVAEDALAFAAECDAREFFDCLEHTFKVETIWRVVHDENQLVDAINEIFRVEGAPYQLTPKVTVEEPNPRKSGPLSGGTIIRTVAEPKVVRAEDEATFTEAIAPALSALSAPYFEAANLEFRNALEEYRKGDYGDSVAKCGSAFESVMKVLCAQKGWPCDPKGTAGPLLKTVLSHTSLEGFFETPLLLIATLRNRLSTAHGGGSTPRTVERHVAQYAITSTAAAIVLLVHEAGA